MKKNWLIYGASGFTGELAVQEAVSRHHYPILAGRTEEKIKPLAEKYGLEYRIFDLTSEAVLDEILKDISLVLHCAGPFIHTSEPMVKACLKQGVHYLDITGEIPVLEKTLSYDKEAKAVGVALISGVGFDVVPTDCMAKYIVDRVPDAKYLEIAIAAISNMSSGTAKSMVEMLPRGGLVRKSGNLESFSLGAGAKTIRFPEIGEKTVIPIPWGDLATAYVSTKVPNIITYMAYPDFFASVLPYLEGMLRYLVGYDFVKDMLKRLIEMSIKGPNELKRNEGRSYVHVKAANDKGKIMDAWLDTLDGYLFTAKSSILSVEKVLEGNISGALTPSMAFGKEFVMLIPTTKRRDTL